MKSTLAYRRQVSNCYSYLLVVERSIGVLALFLMRHRLLEWLSPQLSALTVETTTACRQMKVNSYEE